MIATAAPEIRALKRTLGGIETLDFSHTDMTSAHAGLGTLVRHQVHAYLSRTLDVLDESVLVDYIRGARDARHAIQARLHRVTLDQALKDALRDYLQCLAAWSEGCQLNSFQHAKLSGLQVDGLQTTAQDLAFLLQNEETGCQTGMLRDADGSVLLWHTEEDVEEPLGSRIDAVRLFTFRTSAGKRATSFIYPDLLPGPAFGWSQDTFLQAVDTLNVKSAAANSAVSSNLIAWLMLYLGIDGDAAHLIQAMGPVRNGYAINTIRRSGQKVQASKIEFAGEQWVHSSLPDTVGTYLFQVNIFSQRDSRIALHYEEVTPATKVQLERRVERTERALRLVSQLPEKLPALKRILASTAGGEFAYCNKDVKAYLICHCSAAEMIKWVGSGPALPDDVQEIFR